MALVYRHLKPSGEVFYIGIGSSKKRAYSKSCRNKHWKHTANKYGYEVQILTNNIEFAREIEVNLISYYGRMDLNKGTLVNKTDGGEGFKNMSLDERLKRKERITEYNKTTKDYSFTQNENYKLNMRNSDINTKQIFNSLREASEFNNINYTLLSGMLNNKKNNNTNLKWLN